MTIEPLEATYLKDYKHKLLVEVQTIDRISTVFKIPLSEILCQSSLFTAEPVHCSDIKRSP